MTEIKKDELITRMVDFLRAIGLEVSLEKHRSDSFLPGLRLKNGTLSIDPDKLDYPGDILHEAGHLATMPASIRRSMDGDLPDVDLHRSGEMMAIAWSYAACIHLGISADIVFHENGYKGGAATLKAAFEQGSYIGLPMLQYHEMAYDSKNAVLFNAEPFPVMQKWLCIKVNN